MAIGQKIGVRLKLSVDPSVLEPGSTVNVYAGDEPAASTNVNYTTPINAKPIVVYRDGDQIPQGYGHRPYAVLSYAGSGNTATLTIELFETKELANGKWWFAVAPRDACGNQAAAPHQEVSIQVDSRPERPTALTKGAYDEPTNALTLSWTASTTF